MINREKYPRLARLCPVFFACVLLLVGRPGFAELADDEHLLTLGGFIEAQVEEAVEEQVEEQLEQEAEEILEEEVEEQVAEQIEDRIADRVDDILDEQLLTLGGYIEAKVEERIEDEVAESVEEAVENSITDSITDDVEDSIEESVEDVVEQVVENAIEESLEENVEQVVESSVEDSVEESIENDIEREVVANLEQDVENNVEASVETRVASAVEEQIESEIDEILDVIESGFEADENRINKDQWLVMAEPEVFEELAMEGYLFATVTDLPGLGLRLAEVAAPSSFDISQVRQGVIDVVGKERAEVDLNHFYTAGTLVESPEGEGIDPREAIEFPEDIDRMPLRIGMIDSEVDLSHPSLDKSRVQSRSFAGGGQRPEFHGTAIASIIAADAPGYQGIAPRAEVYAASVFEVDEERGEIASTVSLVRALDWLMSSGVDTVNISLAGPPNRLLEAALGKAQKSGLTILAAAGNGGPTAEPMYPAAYDSVVAVTAVDAGGKVFRLANRGAYLDLAAPGVSLVHARAGGGYTASSGTSFAVPFATTAAARLKRMQPGSNVVEELFRSAQDLGPPGRDEIYGYGLLRPAS